MELRKLTDKQQLIKIKEYVDEYLNSYGSNSFNVPLETLQTEDFCMNEKQELYVIVNDNGKEVGFLKLQIVGEPKFYIGVRCYGFEYEIDIGIYKEDWGNRYSETCIKNLPKLLPLMEWEQITLLANVYKNNEFKQVIIDILKECGFSEYNQTYETEEDSCIHFIKTYDPLVAKNRELQFYNH